MQVGEILLKFVFIDKSLRNYRFLRKLCYGLPGNVHGQAFSEACIVDEIMLLLSFNYLRFCRYVPVCPLKLFAICRFFYP